MGASVAVINKDGNSPILLVCEHACRHIPIRLNGLGLCEEDRRSHIAYDIGAESVSRQMSELLDAPAVLQRYSRLVYDCNRPPESPGAIPSMTGGVSVPGNQNLAGEDRQQRIDEIYHPFHRELSDLIVTRNGIGLPSVIVTIHSFTKWFNGSERQMDFGVLHGEDARLADEVLAHSPAGIITKRNEPYGPGDGVTHTMDLHGDGRLNVMLEICNDLIADEGGQNKWAALLSQMLERALDKLSDELTTDANGLGNSRDVA